MGKFWALEGIDGAGKTTLAAATVEMFRERGMKVMRVAFPTAGPIGKFLRENFLTGKIPSTNLALQHLFMADYVQEQAKLISLVDEYDLVLCDRHPVSSAWVYSGMPPELLVGVVHAGYLLCPELTWLLDVPGQVGFERVRRAKDVAADIFDGESATAFEVRRHRYRAWMDMSQRAGRMLDGTKSVEELAREIGAIYDQVTARAN